MIPYIFPSPSSSTPPSPHHTTTPCCSHQYIKHCRVFVNENKTTTKKKKYGAYLHCMSRAAVFACVCVCVCSLIRFATLYILWLPITIIEAVLDVIEKERTWFALIVRLSSISTILYFILFHLILVPRSIAVQYQCDAVDYNHNCKILQWKGVAAIAVVAAHCCCCCGCCKKQNDDSNNNGHSGNNNK